MGAGMGDRGLRARVPTRLGRPPGLVCACPTDRRVSLAALTTEGQSRLDEAAVVHARDLRQVFAGFSPADLQTLDELLDRLRTATLVPGGSPHGR
jgi:hypothetical protein